MFIKTVRQRLGESLVLGLVAIGAIGAIGCSVELARDLDGAAANEVIVELDRHGIAADKVGGDSGLFRITVAKAQLAAAAQRLQAAELPRASRPGLHATFAKGSLIPTPLEERARLYAALGNDLERTLELYPTVDRARVHLSIDSQAGLVDPPPAPTAAIFVRTKPGGEVNVEEVKQLVAKATMGLDPARIDVVVTRGVADPHATMAAVAGRSQLGQAGHPPTVLLVGFALVAVMILSMGLLYASRRLQQEKAAKRLQPG